MAYRKRVPLLMVLDSIIVLLSIYAGYFILHPYLDYYTTPVLVASSLVLLASHHLFAFIYKLYHQAWEYASVGELVSIIKAVTFSVLTTAVMQLVLNGDIYVRVLGITWMLHVILIGGSRFSWRMFQDHSTKTNARMKRTLIVGAGSAGTAVVRQLLNNPDVDIQPVAFVDDDPHKQKLQIFGLTVLGQTKDIPRLARELRIESIIIAIPSITKKAIGRIYEECRKTDARIQIMPMIEDVMTGKVSVSQLREVEVEDLLGREPVQLDMDSISASITGSTVLVTGAGGSIGSEICRQVFKFHPRRIVLVGHGEFSIYNIDMELRGMNDSEVDIIPVIADIQDRNKMFSIMEQYLPDVVYHAAAHKHVPLMEYNPREAVKNNIFGTRNVAEAADAFGVKTFVMISTDKAVNPPNVMGATKRFAEMIIQNMAKKSPTKFAVVRFGNVLGSRGSVIPLFKKQIREGGPVTVTHPDMTRYFMTIPEASRLVIQAGTLARGGEVFVLDMGEPVKIANLAKNLITLSGFSVDEIGIEYSGIRPGEKMYEELLNEDEIQEEQVFPKIHIGKAEPIDCEELYDLMERFEYMSVNEMREALLRIANRKHAYSGQLEMTQ